jgi:hypothetical protein
VFYGGSIIGVALFLLWIYCIFDVIATEEALVRNMPKMMWLLVVIILPAVGAVAWLVLGRPQKAGFVPGDTNYRQPRKARGPEDSPDFMAGLDGRSKELRRWEEDLKRREDELRRREQDE